MRNSIRVLALGASALALFASACAAGGGSATTQQPPTSAVVRPTTTPPAPATVSSPAAAVASPAAASKPAASPAAASASPVAAAGGAKPTVRVGSTNFTEQIILGELYGQALEANGYPIERKFNLGNREITFPALESGQIDLYIEYLATAEAFVNKANSKGSSDPAATMQSLQEGLRPRGITVLDFAPAIDTNAFVVTKATADRLKLSKLSDLVAVGNQLTLGGPPECPTRPFCLQGLQQTYGITFKDFRSLDTGGPLTVAALEGGQVDVALVFSSDAVIAQKGFVVLQDDKKLQLADNVAPLVRDQLLNAAAADFRPTLNAVSKVLTTEELTGLNKQVGVDRQEPRDVAAAWLKSKALVK